MSEVRFWYVYSYRVAAISGTKFDLSFSRIHVYTYKLRSHTDSVNNQDLNAADFYKQIRRNKIMSDSQIRKSMSNELM